MKDIVKVDDEIKPIPEVKRGRKLKFPFLTMEVGQSFTIETPSRDESKRLAHQCRSSIKGLRKTGQIGTREFVFRTWDDKFTCWRTK